jgi:HEPN domain-containing protein
VERDTYHIGLWNYARSFFRAAAKLRGSEERFSDDPTYYLYGHSIELALKSMLIYKRYSEKDKRKIGHNLKEAWGKAMEEGLGQELENPTEIAQTIELINPYYEDKELEYIVPGGRRYPLISRMHHVSEKLIYAVGKSINIPKSQLKKRLQATQKPRA